MNNFYDTISRDVNKAILENESQIFELKKEEIINQKLKEKDKEIERLNNIINEFEKYLNKVIQTSTEQEKITCSFVLQYLQELKGDDK